MGAECPVHDVSSARCSNGTSASGCARESRVQTLIQVMISILHWFSTYPVVDVPREVSAGLGRAHQQEYAVLEPVHTHQQIHGEKN